VGIAQRFNLDETNRVSIERMIIDLMVSPTVYRWAMPTSKRTLVLRVGDA
jgi:hypothetical protein